MRNADEANSANEALLAFIRSLADSFIKKQPFEDLLVNTERNPLDSELKLPQLRCEHL